MSKPTSKFSASSALSAFNFWNGRMVRYLVLTGLLVIGSTAARAADIDFAKEIRPILQSRCFECHGAEKQEGGLRLDAKAAAIKGGDGGPVIAPGKSDSSELVRRITSTDKDEFMPPKGERLTAEQVALLKKWIESGANWPESAANPNVFKDKRLDHWAWQPMTKPAIPTSDSKWVRNPIDHFVLAKLQEKKLSPSAEAPRSVLIRRLSYDLLGLPPTSDEIDQFVADPDPKAYEKLVDKYLQSPRYGERWARHWLDVVHYGDTHGYDKDKVRPYAWPYRDYVIRALNEDRPHARFIQEQIAGDVLFPDSRDGVVALGFISAGPWDFIGHAEVPESKIDGKIARHLDRDDMVANAIGSFCSVTVHCAQCHNHKFDPFTQEDYYSLQAVFAAVDRADRKYFSDAELTRRFHELEVERKKLTERRDSIEALAKQKVAAELSQLDQQIAAASSNAKGNTRAEFGYHSALEPSADKVKWVQVDFGKPAVLDKVVVQPCFDDFANIGAGFGFPVRYRIELSDDPEFKKSQVIVSKEKDDVPNPGTAAQLFAAQGATGRYLRVTATKLALRQSDYMLALAELQAFDTTGKNVAAGAMVSALDSIEAPPRWRKANLVDSYAPPPDTTGALADLRVKRDDLLKKAVDEKSRNELTTIVDKLAHVNDELKKFPAPDIVYAATVYNGSGAFTGTGANGGKPRPIHILSRGNVTQPGKEVGPGALSLLKMLPGRFELPANHTEGDRRAALAKWLSDPQNPLTWRSAANRIWQYHFGRGIVETANDFGRMGSAPTHPELLDWLACEFRDGGGSWKSLHRLIVTSATYRQSSSVSSAEGMASDADNRWLWRQNRRKLEAEAVHDAVLLVSGKLDLTMGGPGYRDFVIEQEAHSPHYEYHKADPLDAKTWRRSIYRFIVRSQTQPFMTSLDCADPSMRVDKRNESVSPGQALSLLNNGVMVAQANFFAERVQKLAGDDAAKQVEAAYRLALGRLPTGDERAKLVAYVGQHGLANLCRVLFNLNEFVFVD